MFRAVFTASALMGAMLSVPAPADAQELDAQIYELRTYYTNPGLLDHLHKRFREHTNYLFVKHGMRLIGYWVPEGEPEGEQDKLIYILAFPSAEAREKSWQAFRDDPEWQAVSKASEEAAGGRIVAKVESVIMSPTDYSPIR